MEGFGSVLVPDSQAFLNIPSSNATESRPSQRKQSQAKDVLLAKGVFVAVLLAQDMASETGSVCALEAVQ